jgi:hypothetical protein
MHKESEEEQFCADFKKLHNSRSQEVSKKFFPKNSLKKFLKISLFPVA